MYRSLRAAGLVLLVPPSFVAALFLALSRRVAPGLHRCAQPVLMRTWFRILARLLGLRIRAAGPALEGPVLIASNHLSWVDIVAIGATIETAFISKAEIDRWPVVGYFARHGGRTLFIDRGELRSFHALGGTLIGRLSAGGRVVFFPEGTVSAGRGLLRFKPRLFEAALAAGCPVQPLAIAYTGGDGASLAPMGYDDPFVTHMARLLVARRTEVVLRFLPAVEPEHGDRRMLAAETRTRVEQALADGMGPTPSRASIH